MNSKETFRAFVFFCIGRSEALADDGLRALDGEEQRLTATLDPNQL